MKTKLLSTLVLMSFALLAFAQELPYDFAVLEQSYSRLDNPTLHTQGVWDDPGFVADIGFEFVYDSTAYSSLLMSDDDTGGFLYFNTDSLPDHLLFVYASDVVDPGYLDDKSLGYIASQVDGEEGSRIFKIEWNNVGFYNEIDNSGTANNLVNFQLWLYEGSNNIEWHFGPHTIKNPQVHELGGPLLGLTYGLDLEQGLLDVAYILSDDPADPTINTFTEFTAAPPVLNKDPENGTVYRFSSLYVGTQNLPQVASTIEVFPTVVNNNMTVQVDVKNNENLDLTILDLMGRNWATTPQLQSSQTLDLSHLPAGFYFVNVRAGDAVWVQKIVKQ